MKDPSRSQSTAQETRRRRARGEFDAFVDEHAGALLRYADLVVWDLPSAEDLVQECFLRLARRWPKVRSMEYPGAYARRVLFNLALDGASRRHRHRRELGTGGNPILENLGDGRSLSALASVEDCSRLEDALALLAPPNGPH